VMHQHQHVPLPLGLLEAVPQPVVVLLDALLEKDPGRRFQTPADLLNAIPTITDAIDARRKITRQSLQKTPSIASPAITGRPRTIPVPEKISLARLPVKSMREKSWNHIKPGLERVLSWPFSAC
jgi:hypothetical protein